MEGLGTLERAWRFEVEVMKEKLREAGGDGAVGMGSGEGRWGVGERG